MNELCSTREMVERLKDVISRRLGNVYVKDWHVADELRINSSVLSLKIKRDSPPFAEILIFCSRNWIDPLKITMKKEKL